jgi:hypothetical protein
MKKISRFEFAIMQVADPIEAKKNQAYTEKEELEIRSKNLLESAKEIYVETKINSFEENKKSTFQ